MYLALTGNPDWSERGTRLIGLGRCLIRALIRGVRGKDHTASCLHSTHSLLLLLWRPDTVVTAASQTSGGRTVSVEVHTLAEPGYGCERGKKKAGIRKQTHGCRNKARNTFPTTTIYLALAGSGTIRSVFESVIILLHSSSAGIVAPSHACL